MSTFSFDNYMDIVVNRDGTIDDDLSIPSMDDTSLDEQLSQLNEHIKEVVEKAVSFLREGNDGDFQTELGVVQTLIETREFLERLQNGYTEEYEDDEDFDD